jgi:hypothetical protein
MARSYIDPSLVAMAAQPAAPPWDWNPGATFTRAFNDAQENKRAQEKMALEQELAQILLPQKRAEAEFNLKKLAYDSELLTSRYKLMNEEIDERRRIIRTGGVSGGGGGVGQGSLGAAAPTSRYGGGVANLIQAYQSGTLKPSGGGGGGRTLGSGLTGDE